MRDNRRVVTNPAPDVQKPTASTNVERIQPPDEPRGFAVVQVPTGIERDRHRVVQVDRVGIWRLDVPARERRTHDFRWADEIFARYIGQCCREV